jgi:hypothetical protein
MSPSSLPNFQRKKKNQKKIKFSHRCLPLTQKKVRAARKILARSNLGNESHARRRRKTARRGGASGCTSEKFSPFLSIHLPPRLFSPFPFGPSLSLCHLSADSGRWAEHDKSTGKDVILQGSSYSFPFPSLFLLAPIHVRDLRRVSQGLGSNIGNDGGLARRRCTRYPAM